VSDALGQTVDVKDVSFIINKPALPMLALGQAHCHSELSHFSVSLLPRSAQIVSVIQ